MLQKNDMMQYTCHQLEISALLLPMAAFLSYITQVCTVTHVKTKRRILSAATMGELSKKISQDVEDERATATEREASSLKGVSTTLSLCFKGV